MHLAKHEVDFVTRWNVNDVELSTFLDRLCSRRFADVIVWRRKLIAKLCDLMGGKINYDINIPRHAGFAIQHACHRTDDRMPNAQSAQDIVHSPQKIKKLHEASFEPIRLRSASPSNRDGEFAIDRQ